jgi:hypothetical protein
MRAVRERIPALEAVQLPLALPAGKVLAAADLRQVRFS